MENEKNQEKETVTYIAKPVDNQCRWWSAILPDLDASSLEKDSLDLTYLRRGADLELTYGQMIIDSEANHHSKSRGYTVCLGIALADKIVWIAPTMGIKMHIKANGGKNLMKGSGDVNAVVRMAIWLRQSEDLEAAIKSLRSA